MSKGNGSAQRARLKAARQALEANSRRERRAGIRHETARHQRLNSEVIKAEKAVPWWRR